MGPPSLLFSGWVQADISQGLKEMGSENEHSPPSRAELKKHGVFPPLPHYFHGMGRESFTTNFTG
jgi:hypothetical protein